MRGLGCTTSCVVTPAAASDTVASKTQAHGADAVQGGSACNVVPTGDVDPYRSQVTRNELFRPITASWALAQQQHGFFGTALSR
jgi:hypothetical protein